MISEAVFDTNVIVSGILFPDSIPGQVVNAILEGHCRPIISDAILAEYDDVLSRPKFNISPERVHAIIDAFRCMGLPASFALAKNRTQFPDQDDLVFVEAALSLSRVLVTGNKRHFPARWMQGIHVLSPADFLEIG
jgi:putative PIN family toxin of toxin-antitoxin system